MGESANIPAFTSAFAANDPFLRVIDHAHELAEYVFVRVINSLEFDAAYVAVAKCKLNVHLRLSSLTFGVA